MKDNITDFERAEYYKKRVQNQYKVTIVFAVLMFIAGFVIARAIYLLE